MLKLACLALFVALVAAQGNSMMRYLMMQQMMNGGGSSGSGSTGSTGSGVALPMGMGMDMGGSTGSGGAGGLFGGSGSGGLSGMMGSMMNNPLLLCRQTENFQPIPCQQWRNICNIVSMRTYNFPNLMSCSPMGVGCCIKDAMSLMFIQRLG